VTDGIEALDFLHNRGEYSNAPRPDIILLDLNLPRMNGDEFMKELRAGGSDLVRIPIIVLTSSKSEEDIVKSYDLQANAYLTKPVDPEEFVQIIQTFKSFWLEVVRLPPEEER
jgi:CheY-like chemotaxis protein